MRFWAAREVPACRVLAAREALACRGFATRPIQAVAIGSPLLNVLFDADIVDILGYALTTAAVVCLAGVAFPALWPVEMVGKIIMIGLIASYVTVIVIASPNAGSNYFAVGVLTMGLPLAFFRLNLLGEELKERRLV